MSRRAAVRLGVATMTAWPELGLCRSDLPIPLSSELDGHVLARRVGIEGFARVERLGKSRMGRPIDLISVGRGSRSALIVGAPHANEPIGCATIVAMLRRLVIDTKLRESSGWQWHFIPAIDIDGVALNERWFRGDRSLESYLAGFYRPPFRLQPEYTFPLQLTGYRFDTPTPENDCWRRALEHVRPRLQCSLHGADTGGSFFILSDRRPALSAELEGLPQAHDITLNTIGDPSAELAALGPGIFSFAKDPQQGWNAGDSSAGYSSKQFGTFNMVCEVPLWRDARERDSRSSGRSLVEVIGEQIQLLRADEMLLKPLLPALAAKVADDEARALLASVQDAVLQTDGAVEELSADQAAPAAQRILALRDLVQYEAGTAAFRTLAMGLRLARATHMQDVAALVGREMKKRLNRYERVARLVNVPLSASTQLQMAAIVATAQSLN